MNINRITISGFTGKDARPSATQGGRSVTRLSIATTRRYKDSQQQWQEKTQWHTCVAYGSTADYAARIQTGDHVFLEGELMYREYERTVETESGPVKVQWPVSEIIIDSISGSTESRNRKSEGLRKRSLRRTSGGGHSNVPYVCSLCPPFRTVESERQIAQGHSRFLQP